MRPRKTNRHLPPCVYLRHGAFWLVKRGRWTRLGATLQEALAEYARLQGNAPAQGLDRYVDEALAAHRKSVAKETWRQYVQAGLKIKAAFVEFSPEQVRQKHVAEFKRSMADTPNTANRCLSVLRVVFDYLVEQQLVDSNPAVGVKRLEEARRERLITREEFDAIHAKAVPRLQCMMDLMYLTGQRLMDVVNIHESQIGQDGIYFKQAKTGARLTVRWTPELRAVVDRARALNGSARSLTLFRGRLGTPPKYRSVRVQWVEACRAAGVQDAQARDLRAMSGTDAQAQGHDPTRLLGHTGPAMTRRYLRSKVVPVVEGPSFSNGGQDAAKTKPA